MSGDTPTLANRSRVCDRLEMANVSGHSSVTHYLICWRVVSGVRRLAFRSLSFRLVLLVDVPLRYLLPRPPCTCSCTQQVSLVRSVGHDNSVVAILHGHRLLDAGGVGSVVSTRRRWCWLEWLRKEAVLRERRSCAHLSGVTCGVILGLFPAVGGCDPDFPSPAQGEIST